MKRMKKRGLALAALCLTAALALAGCGASSSSSTAAADMAVTESYSYAGGRGWDNGAPGAMASPQEPEAAPETGRGETALQPAKRVYRAELSLETQDFDAAAESLTALVEDCGGWFQDSGVGEYGSGYRHGSYTVRVPAEEFQRFLTQVGELCHVTWQNTSCEDVSEYYYDTAGRLKTQQTKLERLQALLAKAENMEDIITIESAISDTEQAIDSLSGELRHYDSLVGYSTVTLSLEEVYRLSDTEAPATGFVQRLGTALSSGWKGFITGVQGILIALAYGWVWLLVLAAVIVVVLRVLRRKRNRKLSDQPKKEDDGRGKV
ncbi:MAG: DUF4349 domain-containing protein [Dysosmobacter sp.]|nr:DUF4349 domain-containing protein [Dysosmobacter sp.]